MEEQAGSRSWLLGKGIMAGMVSGILFAAVQMLVARSAGPMGWELPWRRFASVLLGANAMTGKATLGINLVGIVVHFLLSGVFGMTFAAAVRALPLTIRAHWVANAIVCSALGIVLWAINYQLIARIAYPWFLTGTHQGVQVLLHAFTFGLPVGIYLTSEVRRRMGLGRGAASKS
jgi:hypothetical protein